MSYPITAIVIPARLQSTRLPQKLLLMANDKPVLAHTIESALACTYADDIGVIADDQSLIDIAKPYTRVMTRLSRVAAACGTNRVGHWVEYYNAWDSYDVIVNLQADEPLIDPRDLDNLILGAWVSETVSTLVCDLDRADYDNENEVKAWMRGNTIRAFSRRMLPGETPGSARAHVGAYAFPRAFRKLLTMRPNARAKAQRLEQVTWIDNSTRIMGVECRYGRPVGINTVADYAKVCKVIRERESAKAR